MTKIRYVMSVIIFTIALVFVGEVYTWYVANFEYEYDYVTFYLQKGDTNESMLTEIERVADKYDIGIFVVDRNHANIFSVDVDICCNNKAKNYLLNNADIKKGKLESILTGNMNVKYKAFTSANAKKTIEYYLIGNDKEVFVNFKQDLMKYAGKYPQKGCTMVNSIMYISMVWLCCLVLMLLMTFYDIKTIQKKCMIQVINGESIDSIIRKRILADTGVFLSIFIFLLIILSNFTNCRYYIGITLLSMGIFLILNACLYIVLKYTNYKKVFSNGEEEKVFLSISYGYKIVSTICTVFILSFAVSQIADGINYYSQKDYFESKKEYSYVEICCDFIEEELEENSAELLQEGENLEQVIGQEVVQNTEQNISLENTATSEYVSEETEDIVDEENEDPSDKYIKDLYATFLELDRVDMICDVPMAFSSTEYLYVNNIKCLDGNIDIDRKLEYDNSKIYIWIHKKYANKKEEIKNYVRGIDENKEIIISEYKNNISPLGISKSIKGYTSRYIKNPCIVYYPGNFDNVFGLGYYTDTCMYRISDFEWLEFLYKHNIENEICYKTNVYDNYLYTLAEKKRNIYVGLMI